MSVCLLVAGSPLALATGLFTLTWTHSVEKTQWQETWEARGAALYLTEARVKGSGAGMDPGPGARLLDGWWVWQPDVDTPALALANSGATGGDWRLCADGACRTLGAALPDPIHLRPCG
ncbi:MAG: DUF1850 domain-containing protein [Gemmobacter sp.]|nr:DUF1850 domain-containing protein [Gemmobacter sp.]